MLQEEEDEEDEEGFENVVVPAGGMQLDPAVMSTLPPSMQVRCLCSFLPS